MYQTLINSQTLRSHLDDPDWVIVDCRFSLTDTGAGVRAYQTGHIPGAVYAHLDDDLSGSVGPGRGRHPLASPAEMKSMFGRLGINQEKQVIAYDDINGTIASRLWWMLRYMSHQAVAVLDGGWADWTDRSFPVESGERRNSPVEFDGIPQDKRLATADEAAAAALLVDSRGGERYRGEVEPYDKVAGHIPGAVNYFYQENWTKDSHFMPVGALRTQLEALLGQTAAGDTVFYCGSGVSACANLLALAHAGLGDGRLYVGSWSGWSSDPSRPIATT